MSALDLMTRPCTLIQRSPSGETDRFGNPKRADTPVDTVCELQQVGQRQRANEPGEQGEMSDTTWVLFLPAGTGVSTADIVVVDGREYEFVGDPWDAWDPIAQAMSHIEATVRRTRGAADEDGS